MLHASIGQPDFLKYNGLMNATNSNTFRRANFLASGIFALLALEICNHPISNIYRAGIEMFLKDNYNKIFDFLFSTDINSKAY